MTKQLIDYSLDYLGRPKTFVAAYAGRSKELEEALKDPAQRKLINTQVRTQGGQTLLHVACFGSANAATVRILLEAGSKEVLLAEDNMGRIPLDIAANAAEPAILTALLSLPLSKFLYAHPDKLDRTPLHAMCMPGSSPKEKRRGEQLVASLELLLNKFDSKEEREFALARKDKFGITPLMYAQHFGYTEVIQTCAKLGFKTDEIPEIPPNSPALEVDYWGRIKLMQVAFDKDEEQVAQILENPSLSNHPTIGNAQFGNINALHYAARNGTPKILQMLLADPRTNPMAVDDLLSTALHNAANRGNAEVIAELLTSAKIKQNINCVDQFGMTPLHALAMASSGDTRLQALDLLVKNGADLHARNNNGDTPHDVAIKRGNTVVATALRAHMYLQNPGYFWSFASKVQAAKDEMWRSLGYTTTTAAANNRPKLQGV